MKPKKVEPHSVSQPWTLFRTFVRSIKRFIINFLLKGVIHLSVPLEFPIWDLPFSVTLSSSFLPNPPHARIIYFLSDTSHSRLAWISTFTPTLHTAPFKAELLFLWPLRWGLLQDLKDQLLPLSFNPTLFDFSPNVLLSFSPGPCPSPPFLSVLHLFESYFWTILDSSTYWSPLPSLP